MTIDRDTEVDGSDPSDIDVGADGAGLRLWLAKEAVRLGEVLLAAQQNNLVAMEARASSIFGWSVPSILGLGAVALHSPFAKAAAASAVCLFGAAIGCAIALWPRPWSHVGYNPKITLDWRLASELEILESIAQGYGDAASENDRRLVRFGTWLRVSWGLFVSGPAVGALGVVTLTLF